MQERSIIIYAIVAPLILALLATMISLLVTKIALKRARPAVAHNQEESKKESSWKFSDWSGTLTSIGTVLGIILPFVQQNPLITGLSLIFGAVVLLAPMTYTALFPFEKRPLPFRIFSTLTLWAILAELGAAYEACDDFSKQVVPHPIPSSMIAIFRGLLEVAGLIAIFYTVNSTCDVKALWAELTPFSLKGWQSMRDFAHLVSSSCNARLKGVRDLSRN